MMTVILVIALISSMLSVAAWIPAGSQDVAQNCVAPAWWSGLATTDIAPTRIATVTLTYNTSCWIPDTSCLVEAWMHGGPVVGRLVAATYATAAAEPKLILQHDSRHSIVDWGQVTTLWPNTDYALESRLNEPSTAAKAAASTAVNAFYRERALVKVRRDKQVEASIPVADLATWRRIQKCGPAAQRLVDGGMVAARAKVGRRRLAALAFQDEQASGRWKRFPSLLLNDQSHDQATRTWTIFNGGWLIQDASVAMTTQVRQFLNRSSEVDSSQIDSADQRMLRRLECLALGQGSTASTGKMLHADVRAILSQLDLAVSPAGARQALVRLGHWMHTNDCSSNRFGLEPWSTEIRQAAAWYQTWVQHHQLDRGRIDLTRYPCLCIDETRTTFRDDALGLRPRAATGRPVTLSKWEILIHVADVSDVYAPHQQQHDTEARQHLATLCQAAQSRGSSRYDLPLGPLHLLPPVALAALSLGGGSKKQNRCVTLWVYLDPQTGRVLESGLERTVVSNPICLNYQQAQALLDHGPEQPESRDIKATWLMLVALEKYILSWKHAQSPDSMAVPASRGHDLVDAALDLYGHECRALARKAKVPLPYTAGASLSQGGRLATAPLRRYIDGMAQRQLLAGLCQYGGEPLTAQECREIGKIATDKKNAIQNVKSHRNSRKAFQPRT
jgi:RNB domain